MGKVSSAPTSYEIGVVPPRKKLANDDETIREPKAEVRRDQFEEEEEEGEVDEAWESQPTGRLRVNQQKVTPVMKCEGIAGRGEEKRKEKRE
jgi:hypothetical protein